MTRQHIQAVVATLCFVIAASSATAQQAAAPQADLHYYNGASRVDIVIARDELAVPYSRNRSASISNLALAAPGATFGQSASGDVLVRYPNPASDLNGLAARARAIAAVTGDVAPVAYPAESVGRPEARTVITKRIALRLNGNAPLNELLTTYGLRLLGRVDYSPSTYIVETASEDLFGSIAAANALFESGLTAFATPEVSRQQTKRLVLNDVQFNLQWHLRNTGQVPGTPGEDVNILSAWDNYTGAGVNIAVTDTGVQVNHPDLAPNARTDIDLDINGGDDDPTPSFDPHGTEVAGIAAARGNNTIGVTGAAFEAGIVGIRLIEASTTDQDEADAMNHQVTAVNPANRVHVNSNSWGPADCGCILGGIGPLTLAALQNGVENGRGGLGTIYVWAAGNGRTSNDNVNYDEYASSRYTIAVGATGANGTWSWYSEPGASMLVNTPSSDSTSGTTTTTLTSAYTNSFGGTSSAAPLAAGAIALMLEANPNLTWRDVQHILVETAEQNDPVQAGWLANGSGRLFNQNYGFGRLDATAAVTAAQSWAGVPPSATPVGDSITPNVAIPDNTPAGVTSNIAVSGAPADFFIEHVEVVANITHPRRGQLSIVLTAPSGYQSVLAGTRSDTGANYSNWRFTSVAHWGEDPNGTWSFRVVDNASGFAGTLNDWTLTIHGHSLIEAQGPPDADQDLLSDDDEINIYGTDPNNPDTDGDGVLDGIEVELGTDPLDSGDFPLLPGQSLPMLATLIAMLTLLGAGNAYQTRTKRYRNTIVSGVIHSKGRL